MRTWNYWEKHHDEKEPLDLRHYEAIGSMKQALSRHANEAFTELKQGTSEELGARNQHLAERLFRTITELGARQTGSSPSHGSQRDL